MHRNRHGQVQIVILLHNYRYKKIILMGLGMPIQPMNHNWYPLIDST